MRSRCRPNTLWAAVAILLIATLCPPAQARHFHRQLRDMRHQTSGRARYGSYQVRERVLSNGNRFKLIKHFDHNGKNIASSQVLFDRNNSLIKERVKLRLPGGLGADTAKVAAQVWSIQLRLTRMPHRMPTAAAAAVDLAQGKVYYGRSGRPRPTNVSTVLRSRIPSESLESWRVDNCAEFKTVNKALLQGSNLRDLVIHTVRTSSGRDFPRCKNCKITTAGSKVTSDIAPAARHHPHRH